MPGQEQFFGLVKRNNHIKGRKLRNMTTKEKLENKIESLMDYLTDKPNEKITSDDYLMMSSELRDIRFREKQAIDEARNEERMAKLMVMGFPSAFNGISTPKEEN